MRRIAVIPARGGSKRLPRKNILPIQGKPMLAWTIAAAHESACFERVVVSTEDGEIENVARRYGAEVAKRDPRLAADEATVAQVCLDLLEREEGEGRGYEVMSCLYATAPLRQAADIRAVIELIDAGVCDFALAVTDYAQPAHQALRAQPDGTLAPMWPDLVNRRPEAIGKLVVDNGSTYAASVPAFREHRSFYGPRLRGHLMPRSRSVDIDDEDDLSLAEYFACRALM